MSNDVKFFETPCRLIVILTYTRNFGLDYRKT